MLLWDANASKNVDFSVNVYSSFKLDEKNAAVFKAEFDFRNNVILCEFRKNLHDEKGQLLRFFIAFG